MNSNLTRIQRNKLSEQSKNFIYMIYSTHLQPYYGRVMTNVTYIKPYCNLILSLSLSRLGLHSKLIIIIHFQDQIRSYQDSTRFLV